MEKQSYKSQANKQQDRQVDQSEKLETFELSRQDQMRHLIQSEFIHRCKKTMPTRYVHLHNI